MASHHPIIALWSHPRSMSTAMERIMRERGDLICAHEPFMYDYYVHRQVRVMPNFDIEKDRPQSYREIRNWLMEQAKTGPVFFKDMSYYVIPKILEDEEFLKRITHTFLIRNPVASILSYYKLDEDVTSEEIGLESQWKHYEVLQERGINATVIEAESVRADTKGTISQFWKKIGLSHIEEAFDWQEEKPSDWKQVSGWHGDVMQSKGIRAESEDEAEKKRRQFDEHCANAPQLRAYLEYHLPYYKKLKAKALR